MKQRSKQELLKQIRIHQALKKDLSKCDREQLSGNVAFWRASVEWIYVLWKQEKMNVVSLQKMLEYTVNNYAELTEERRCEIREKMQECSWILKNRVVRKKCKNAIDQTWNDMEYFNTEVSVNFSLLVCEWLIDKKKYKPQQIDRACELLMLIDTYPVEKVYAMRQIIYKHKGIWIQLNEEDTEKWVDCEDVDLIAI